MLAISASTVDDWDALVHCTKLIRFHTCEYEVDIQSNFRDLSLLRNCVDIENIHAGVSLITDITPLKSFRKLKVLGLGGGQIADYRPLSDVQSLEYICLNHSNFQYLGHACQLVNLKRLDCAATRVTDLEPLLQFRGLLSLNIYLCKISCYAPLLKLNYSLYVTSEIFHRQFLIEPRGLQM